MGQRLQHLSDRRRRERRLVVRSVRLGGRGVPAHRSGEGQRTQPDRRDAELDPCVEGVTKICRSFHGIAVGQRCREAPAQRCARAARPRLRQVAAGSDLDTDYYGSTGFRPGDTVCSLLVSNAVVKSAFLKALAATGTHIDIARFTVSMAAAIAEALRPLPKAMLDGASRPAPGRLLEPGHSVGKSAPREGSGPDRTRGRSRRRASSTRWSRSRAWSGSSS